MKMHFITQQFVKCKTLNHKDAESNDEYQAPNLHLEPNADLPSYSHSKAPIGRPEEVYF